MDRTGAGMNDLPVKDGTTRAVADAAVTVESFDFADLVLIEPEGQVPDLDLSQHTEGSWPSSKNVSQ